MLIYDKNNLKRILIEREGYNELEANSEVKYLKNLNSNLQETFDNWLNKGEIGNFSVGKVTIHTIMEKSRVNFLSALTSMSVFIDEPKEAKKYLKRPIFFNGISLFNKYKKE